MKIGMRKAGVIFFFLMAFPSLAGCVRLALHLSGSMIPNMAQALFEECDPDLAKQSMPAQLKLMEGLLKTGARPRRF